MPGIHRGELDRHAPEKPRRRDEPVRADAVTVAPSRPRQLPVHKRRDRFDPAPELGRLRAESPLVRMDLGTGPSSRPGWLVTGHDEVRAILGDYRRFSTLPPADSRADSRRLVQIGNLLHYD